MQEKPTLFRDFWRNMLDSFRGLNIVFYLLAIFLTAGLVYFGADAAWFKFFSDNPYLQRALMSAAFLGMAVPLIGLTIAYFTARKKRNEKILTTILLMAQAALSALIISSVFKAFTGRVPPELFSTVSSVASQAGIDGFRFGFLRGGIFYGWPSGHAIVAFAMALSLIYFFPDKKWLKIIAILYALFISFGVSATIHWFSDAVSGALMGATIGIAVGKSFFRAFGQSTDPVAISEKTL